LFALRFLLLFSFVLKTVASRSSIKDPINMTTAASRIPFAEAQAAISSRVNANPKLGTFLRDWIDLCRPDFVYWCNGTDQEYQDLCEELVESNTFIRLNPAKRPNSYLARSAPSDVARVEARTFVCCEEPEDAGPTNNWRYPGEMMPKIRGLMHGCMVGRTMYVIPFVMGPLGSPLSHVAVQITDSAYVAASMKIMTAMGDVVMPYLLKADAPFVPCVHSVGCPIHRHEHMHLDVEVPAWPSDRDGIKFITHFPDDGYDHMIVSYGSGYGGNALLGKKCLALRIASILGRKQGWQAEHMLIAGITNPQGEKSYIAAAFPSQCGKTNLAMLDCKLPGWNWQCVGDDIMWAKVRNEKDGRMYAVNPERGIFGVAPGSGPHTLKNAIDAVSKNCIFTNVGLTADNDVWWEGLTKEIPAGVIDWTGKPFVADAPGKVVSHSNARFTAPLQQCPTYDPAHEDPEGVPLSALMLGGRRSRTVPLVFEALSWEHGVYMGATLRSEGTSAAETAIGQLRFDPFAMLPFCAYNMADYFSHWLDVGASFTSEDKQPRIFFVNWFRKDDKGKFLWPGFSENARIIKWILERCKRPRDDTTIAIKTPIGYIPTADSLDVSGLNVSLDQLLAVDLTEWQQEADAAETYLRTTFGDRLPQGLLQQSEQLKRRIQEAATTN
jgi:phosphoenolpyruvate carboxykinase (GTP)